MTSADSAARGTGEADSLRAQQLAALFFGIPFLVHIRMLGEQSLLQAYMGSLDVLLSDLEAHQGCRNRQNVPSRLVADGDVSDIATRRLLTH